jgi:hypothetical protein
MIVWKNDDALVYRAKFGSVFKATRSDLRAGVAVEHPDFLSADQCMRDCVEFGGWHGTNVHPYLNGFSGYDTVRLEVADA